MPYAVESDYFRFSYCLAKERQLKRHNQTKIIIFNFVLRIYHVYQLKESKDEI